MKKLLAIVVLGLLWSGNAIANSIERELLIKFDGLCVQNISNLKSIVEYAELKKWTIIPPGKDALIAPQKKGPSYKSFGFIENSLAFLIGINDAENKNSCSIATQYKSIADVKKILNEFYKIKLINSQNQGIQNLEIYEVDLMQSVNKGMIVLNFSNQKGYEFVSLTVMVSNE